MPPNYMSIKQHLLEYDRRFSWYSMENSHGQYFINFYITDILREAV